MYFHFMSLWSQLFCYTSNLWICDITFFFSLPYFTTFIVFFYYIHYLYRFSVFQHSIWFVVRFIFKCLSCPGRIYFAFSPIFQCGNFYAMRSIIYAMRFVRFSFGLFLTPCLPELGLSNAPLLTICMSDIFCTAHYYFIFWEDYLSYLLLFINFSLRFLNCSSHRMIWKILYDHN